MSGPKTGIDFACGVDIDPVSREIYMVNNDTHADLVVFGYDAHGDVPPSRILHPAGRGSWGVSVDRIHDEVAVSVEHINKVVIFRRTGQGVDEKPLRIIQGPHTGMSDPHGVFLDGKNDEIFVANHTSWHDMPTGGADPGITRLGQIGGREPGALVPSFSTGKFVLPSITVYSRTATGDAVPLRVIQGLRTEINLPMKIHVDTVHDELLVANSGTNSLLVFGRTAGGDVAPLRKIQGPATRLSKPHGVFVDVKNDEIWAANPADHTATVYPRTASGNVPPLRVLRGAPDGTPAAGLGNPGGVAYDAKRQVILVPN